MFMNQSVLCPLAEPAPFFALLVLDCRGLTAGTHSVLSLLVGVVTGVLSGTAGDLFELGPSHLDDLP